MTGGGEFQTAIAAGSQVDGGTQQIGFPLLVGSGSKHAVGIACGFVLDRFDLRKVLFVVLFLTSVFTVLLGLAQVQYTGLVLFMQSSFVIAFFPVGLVIIAKAFAREMRSLATGIIVALSVVFGGGLIPYLLGVSGDLYSFRLGITVFGVLIMPAGALVFRLQELRRQE